MPNTELHSPNSPNETPNSGKTTPTNSNVPARATQRRKIDGLVIDAMASYVAMGHTETEAAHLCHIKPSTWREFKSRNLARATKWTERMESYKAQLINHNLQQVQKAADGVGVKYPDFRASLAMLKIQGGAARFGDTPTIEMQSPTFILSSEKIREILDKLKPALPVVDIKQITDTPKTQ